MQPPLLTRAASGGFLQSEQSSQRIDLLHLIEDGYGVLCHSAHRQSMRDSDDLPPGIGRSSSRSIVAGSHPRGESTGGDVAASHRSLVWAAEMSPAMAQAQADRAELDKRERALSAKAQENEAVAAAQARNTAGDRAQLQALQVEFRRGPGPPRDRLPPRIAACCLANLLKIVQPQTVQLQIALHFSTHWA